MLQQNNFVEIPFLVELPIDDPQARIYISGDIGELGNWVNSKAIQLKLICSKLWYTSIKVSNTVDRIEWKYFQLDESNGITTLNWQKGNNNIINANEISNLKLVQDSNKLSLMTFNIRYENNNDGINIWKARREIALKIINESQADFIGLQEVLWSQSQDIKKGTQYEYIGRGRGKTPQESEASPILYNKFKWHKIYDTVVWLSPMPEVPGTKCFTSNHMRIATFGVFQSKYNENIRIMVVNTHFDLNQHCRKQSVDVLFTYLLKIRIEFMVDETVFMGDLNVERDDKIIKKITENQTFKFIQLSPVHIRTFHDFQGESYEFDNELDHIFYSGNTFKLNSYERVLHSHPLNPNIFPSDHYPIKCILQRI